MKMATGPNSCFSNMYEDVVVMSNAANGSDNHSTSLLYNLSLLKEKVQQVQSLAAAFISQSQTTSSRATDSVAIQMDNIGGLLQEIIITASSMMFTCQSYISSNASPGNNPTNTFGFENLQQPNNDESNAFEWCTGDGNIYGTNENNINSTQVQQEQQQVERYKNKEAMVKPARKSSTERLSSNNYDIIEMDAADLLAKYTHYCQICGKGFKRDANLRMHMRAHGDEYKSTAALTNPAKNNSTDPNGLNGCTSSKARKYSCPQEGCRWNRKHAKFQPLKSMICVKNHYKRTHCPKMYVCKRCNRKQFSVLSDLRTHEKHCGDVKWQCSCGTTFSRKDKLMGHVGLFIGHTPVVVNISSSSNGGSLINEAAGNAFDKCS